GDRVIFGKLKHLRRAASEMAGGYAYPKQGVIVFDEICPPSLRPHHLPRAISSKIQNRRAVSPLRVWLRRPLMRHPHSRRSEVRPSNILEGGGRDRSVR